MASPEIPQVATSESSGPQAAVQQGPDNEISSAPSTQIELQCLKATSQQFEPQLSSLSVHNTQLANMADHQADVSTGGSISSPAEGSESQATDAITSDVQASSSADIVKPALTREMTVPAIGPATDNPSPLGPQTTTDGPILYITLLLANTGARHPFKLDGKYLKKRGVEVEDQNPINMSLYKLKELILRDWREGKQGQ